MIDGVLGNDALTSTTALASVTIKDVNDEPPQFNKREYSVKLPENIPDGTTLPNLDMIVTDPDVVSNLTLYYLFVLKCKNKQLDHHPDYFVFFLKK